jgi:hypothetical protein
MTVNFTELRSTPTPIHLASTVIASAAKQSFSPYHRLNNMLPARSKGLLRLPISSGSSQ